MDLTIIIFGTAVLCTLLLIIISAFVTKHPRDIAEVAKRQVILKDEMLQLSIRQIHALNVMLKSGTISQVNYDIERIKITHNLNQCEIDSHLILCIPRPEPPIVKDMINRTMIISNELAERGDITDEQLNSNINIALDSLKNL